MGFQGSFLLRGLKTALWEEVLTSPADLTLPPSLLHPSLLLPVPALLGFPMLDPPILMPGFSLSSSPYVPPAGTHYFGASSLV